MKKNLMMRIASFLLVAVLISTSAISGTYAKYTTQDAGSDEARVAKWGVELQVFGNLYGDTYKDLLVETTDTENIRVQSVDAADDVVAPGTKNEEGFEISLRGTPEVDGIITSTITTQNIFLKAGSYGVMVPVNAGAITKANFEEIKEVTAGELYKKDGSNFVPVTAYEDVEYYTLEDAVSFDIDYYPVVYKMDGSTKYEIGNVTGDSLTGIAAILANTLKLDQVTTTTDGTHVTTYTGTTPVSFDSNTDLTGYALDDLTITWEWKYDWDECGKEGDAANILCKADTILGNLQAGDLNVVKLNGTTYEPVAAEFYCLNTQFAIDITVTQVD